MDEREQFAIAAMDGSFCMSVLCASYGISRKTGYKWLARYDPEDVSTLEDRSRAPHSCPHATAEDVRKELIAARKSHPFWGPRKLLAHLSARRPELSARLPAASTYGDLLKRAGLVEPRRRRQRVPHPGGVPLEADAPNDVWCADFKGEFRTQDRVLCYPLTVTDAHSRMLLLCKGLSSTAHEGARSAFERLFAEAGLPGAIRTDNGCPFSSKAINGLSRLSVWWIKLGIIPDRITPASPHENGQHERMHRTLKAETTRPPARNASAQQSIFDAFLLEFNEERPHEGIDMKMPASLWTPSPRPLPARLPDPEYPGHMEVRRVRHTGQIKFAGRLMFLSEVLSREWIALEEVDDGVWHVYFYNTLLASLDERAMVLVPIMPTRPTRQRRNASGHRAPDISPRSAEEG